MPKTHTVACILVPQKHTQSHALWCPKTHTHLHYGSPKTQTVTCTLVPENTHSHMHIGAQNTHSHMHLGTRKHTQSHSPWYPKTHTVTCILVPENTLSHIHLGTRKHTQSHSPWYPKTLTHTVTCRCIHSCTHSVKHAHTFLEAGHSDTPSLTHALTCVTYTRNKLHILLSVRYTIVRSCQQLERGRGPKCVLICFPK